MIRLHTSFLGDPCLNSTTVLFDNTAPSLSMRRQNLGANGYYQAIFPVSI